MPRRYTLLDLRTRCLRRADKENDPHIGSTGASSEANSLVSETYGELYSAVASTGDRYFETSTDFTMAGLSYIAEPVDHLSTVDTIERLVDATTGRLLRLRPIGPQLRARWSGRTGHARRWEFADDRINLYPTPPSGDVYRLRYIAQPPEITNYADSDVIDVVNPHGLAFLIWGTAIKMMSKSESDVQLAVAERNAALERLLDWARDRVQNEPKCTYVDNDDDDELYREGDWRYDR